LIKFFDFLTSLTWLICLFLMSWRDAHFSPMWTSLQLIRLCCEQNICCSFVSKCNVASLPVIGWNECWWAEETSQLHTKYIIKIHNERICSWLQQFPLSFWSTSDYQNCSKLINKSKLIFGNWLKIFNQYHS